jgi:hypothetical protein
VILLAADLVRLLRGDSAPKKLFEAIERGAVISIISFYELARGLPHIKIAKLKSTLEGYGIKVVEIDLALLLTTERFWHEKINMELVLALAISSRERLEILTGSPQDIPDEFKSNRILPL